MSYAVDGNQVSWHYIEALPPWDSAEDQKINEVFSSVPWMRVADAPEQ